MVASSLVASLLGGEVTGYLLLRSLFVKITSVSGQILSQNVEFVMTSLIISACAKT